MQKQLVINGVPGSLARDGWWLCATADTAGGGGATGAPGTAGVLARGGPGRMALLLAGLVAAGDVLFYGHPVGISVPIFAVLTLVASAATLPRGGSAPSALVVLGVAALPSVEHLQALSLAFLGVGLVLSVIQLRGGGNPVSAGRLRAALRLAACLPFAGIGAALGAIRAFGLRAPERTALRRLTRHWAMPVGGALILLALMTEANPVIAGWLDTLAGWQPDLSVIPRRVLFWAGLALLVWPLICHCPDPGPAKGTGRQSGSRPDGVWINAVASTNALIVFNLILGVQTGLDLLYLWGQGTLPEGMSPAEYAHRGAYPLLATALLAGAFAVLVRPFLAERRGLRLLSMLWIGQNLALTASAAYRLAVYVEAFGLTYLRVHAGIWMAVVAAGLVLTAWQCWRNLPTGWLLWRCAALGVAVLYVCCFVNFAQIIARENLRRDDPDLVYLCRLGPMARPAFAQGQAGLCPHLPTPSIDGWRDWGFRTWRVARNLAAVQEPEGADEDPRR